MYKQSDAALTAWRATERTLDAKVTITDSSGNETDYATSDITSIAYDSGAWTGDTFSVGSTYENNITVTFAHLVEGLKQGYKVTAKIGIKLPDGTYEYCPLGVFIISDEITMDRNNDATTIKAYDQFCVIQGTYTSKLTYPAKVTDVIAEIANMSGVTLNTNDIAELPTQTDIASAISGQTYCTAIGWIAQFYGGFALFDRDGKLTIRTVTDASYILDASQYEQSGLTKNEATYQIGGMSVSVTTTTTDSTGENSETTSTLTAGETTGSQIELTNNVMTQTRLDSIWSTIKDITFYPYSLTWFGNPAIEAGDWLTLKDTAGNSFNVPNNSYTMTFDGGLTATSKADQTSTSSSSYSYSGALSQTVKQLAGRQGATGNYIFGTDTTVEPTTAKIGDLWYKQNGNQVEMWQYVKQSDGTGKWELIVSDATGEEIKANVDKAMAEADTAKQNANAAVSDANSALTKAQTGIDTANTAADNANTAMSNSNTAINNAKSAMTDAATAISTANNSSDIANAVQQQITTLKDGSTMTIADLENGLALKLTKSDLDGYATQSWTSNQITVTANGLQSQVASVKSTADKATIDITTLNQRADGWDSSITSLNTNKADQSWTTNQIKASADSLNVNISKVQTQVNDSAVGTNLLKRTYNFDASLWSIFGVGTGTGVLETWTDYGSQYFSHIYAFSENTLTKGPVTKQNISLVKGQPYTISVSAQHNGAGYGDLAVTLYLFSDYTSNVLNGAGIWLTDTLADSLTKYSATFVPTVSGTYSNWRILAIVHTGASPNMLGSFWTTLPKLELGSVATDWSANPADNATVTSVTNLSVTLEGLKSTVSQKVDNTTFSSYQTQTATLIGTKVASNDFTSYKTQTDNAISQRVTSSAFSSYQTQTDSAIQQRVTSATYNAEVTILSNQIDSKVTAGGDITNICLNPYFDGGSSRGWSAVKVSSGNGRPGVTYYGGQTSRDNFYGDWVNVAPNEVYYFQIFAWQDSSVNDFNFGLKTMTKDGTIGGYSAIHYTPSESGMKSATFTIPSDVVKAQIWTQIGASSNFGTWWFTRVYVGKTAPAGEMYSQIQQLSDNINLRVVKNDVINQINVSSESILIAGNKVHITGSTTIDNAVIKSAMIDSISADKITAGTLNAANVNVINLNANNISSGTLSGDYISGGTITGVSFHQTSSNHDTWIDQNGIHDYDGSGNNAWIKQGTLQVYDSSNQGIFMQGGKLILSKIDVWSSLASMSSGATPTVDDYGIIEHGVGTGLSGIKIHGTDSALLSDNSGKQAGVVDTGYWGIVNGAGFAASWNLIQMGGDESWMAAIQAGTRYGTYTNSQPSIRVGTVDWAGYTGSSKNVGQNVVIEANGIWLNSNGETHIDCSNFYFAGAHCDGGSLYNSSGNGWWMRNKDGSMATIHVQSVSQSSLLSLKTNLNKLDPAKALATLTNTDICSYNYKSDLKNGISKTYATAVIDDVNDKPQYNTPYDFISADGTGRDDGTILGYAVASIQELNSKITSLETEIKQLKGAA